MLLETEWISEIIEFIFFSADEVIARPTVTTAARRSILKAIR